MGHVEGDLFGRTIARFATGVTVITARYNGRDHGVTARHLSTLSCEPPVLVVCIDPSSPVHDAVLVSNVLAVNVLALDQEHLAEVFADPDRDPFAEAFLGITIEDGLLDVPVLSGVLAHFECRVTDLVAKGAHTVFLAEVVAVGATDREPLLSYRGRHRALESLERS